MDTVHYMWMTYLCVHGWVHPSWQSAALAGPLREWHIPPDRTRLAAPPQRTPAAAGTREYLHHNDQHHIKHWHYTDTHTHATNTC